MHATRAERAGRHAVLLAAAVLCACHSEPLDEHGRPCDEGRCLPGYTCDTATNICVTTGDGCGSDGDCDDANPCTQDACSAGACEHVAGNAGVTCREADGPCDVAELCTGTSATCPADELAPDGSVIVLSGPASTPVGQPATLLLEACPGLGGEITCTASSARYALFTQDFQAGLGGFSGTGVSTGTCNVTNAGVVPAGATASDDCSGAIMVITQTRTARAQPTLAGAGMTALRVNLKVGMSTEADSGEVLGIRACCGDVGTTCAGPLQLAQQVGSAAGDDDGGKDGWGARPCLSGTCSGAGYALGGSFDGCAQMALELIWNASGGGAGNEVALVDDVVVSGAGTPTLPLTDNGDGTYQLSVIPYETGSVTVTCVWGAAAGTPTDSWTMAVGN